MVLEDRSRSGKGKLSRQLGVKPRRVHDENHVPAPTPRKPLSRTSTSVRRVIAQHRIAGKLDKKKALSGVRTPLAEIPTGQVHVNTKGENARPEGESDQSVVEKVQEKVALVEDRILELERLVAKFQGSVEGISKDFEALQNDLAEYSNEYEAVVDDYLQASRSVVEEKETVEHWENMYRNTEKELQLAYMYLPAEHQGMAYSQVR
ncbi:hypothetical protein DFP72DRAFT_1074869 [Ephemerocybe angulata]|uniref:Uncharacterized protein n=1 Tax=Ephemerocybe angulata TaxID=980116 RepID=A0A8H6H7K8_9AGAR|nr:hypothetical protein DFP72DRAFT_864849 [Tulosesus angulatus]KAF6747993.1 hypothetical protein DFP72DRAFT_1074869 [Tulosesus angulatus]